VDEVGRAVERIDDPDVLAVLRAVFAARLLGEDAVAGVGGQQRLDDRSLGRAVDLGDEVVRALAVTCSRSRSSAARLMIAPAPRAALTAMLSMGWRACDMGRRAARRRVDRRW
jgi:hypothetical protein